VIGVVRDLQGFLRDETGPELVEWAVVTIILLVATVAAYRIVGDKLKEILDRIGEILDAVRTGGGL